MNHMLLSSLAIAQMIVGASSYAADEQQKSSTQSVKVYRDAMGVPHVFSDTSAAVMFGAGYAIAQDRLVDLELARLGAVGRRSEVLGRSAVKYDTTSRNRMLDTAELMRMYRAIPKEHQLMMRAYVDGINKAIAEVIADPARRTPYEFKQWGYTPQRWTLIDYLHIVAAFPRGRDSYEVQNLAFFNAMTTRYGQKVGREIFDDVVPINDPDSPTTIPEGEDLAPAQPMPVATHLTLASAGPSKTAVKIDMPEEAKKEHSRCLVIGPQRSANGNVLMMEATADGPEIGLHGGGFDSAGFTGAAWAVPIMGRGPQHGWLVTSGHADTTDTFAERLNPKNRYQYWYNGKWHNMARRTGTILVKGGDPIEHDVVSTIHGTVIGWDINSDIAYTHRVAQRGHELDNWVAVVEINRARNIDEFERKGVARLATSFGICYGDEKGQIAFWETGLMPKRAEGADSRLPTPGTGEYEWQGFLSFAERPHMRNPKQGYIHNWNSKATPWMREGDDARIGATFRTWLGNRLGAEGTSLTLIDVHEINRKIWNAMGARDRTQTSPDFFAPFLTKAKAETSDADVVAAIDLMLSWNGLYEDQNSDGYYDNPGLSLFREWLEIAPKAIFADDIEDWWKKIDEDRYLKYQTSLLYRVLQGEDAPLPVKFDYLNGRSRDAVLIDTVKQAVAVTKARHPGKSMHQWRLPIYWKYFRNDIMDPDRLPLPDDEERISTTWAELGLGPAMVPLNGGESWVGSMDLGKDRALYTVVEVGGQNQFIDAAGNGNPHLTDQVAMHAQNRFKRIDLSREQIERSAISVQIFDYVVAASTNTK